MPNPNRKIDKTSLSIDIAEDRQIVHRDYIAHCLRWSHIIKYLLKRGTYRSAGVLDIGCGRETPLLKTMYTNKIMPKTYLGVDPNPIPNHPIHDAIRKIRDFYLYEEANYLELDLEKTPLVGSANVIVCLEVLEHVQPSMAFDMLVKIRDDMHPLGQAFISTPCWNRTACAANHINEITYDALGAMMEDIGFRIESMNGTFASQRDYLDEFIIRYKCPELFTELHEYYDSNLLSVIFAPLFPSLSRNCIWRVTKNQEIDYRRHFPNLMACEQPLSSSNKWEDYLIKLEEYRCRK